jgi:hypothetical protein
MKFITGTCVTGDLEGEAKLSEAKMPSFQISDLVRLVAERALEEEAAPAGKHEARPTQ